MDTAPETTHEANNSNNHGTQKDVVWIDLMRPDSQSRPTVINFYSLVHFIVGLFAGAALTAVNPLWLVVIHQLFEIWESFPGRYGGLALFNMNWIPAWVQGFAEYEGDSAMNSAADTLFFVLGVMLGRKFR